MVIFLMFFFGLFLGSFLNVLVDRVVVGESVISGRSHCEKCKKNIAWYDLIPVLSFILLKRKCRYCKAPLSYYYLITELATGILLAVTFISFNSGSLVTLVYYLAMMSVLVVVFFEDLKYGTISDKVIYPSIIASIIFLAINPSSFIINHLLSAIGAFAFFLILLLITHGKGMGFGDIKFSFLMGLFLGFPQIIVGLYLAFLTGAVAGVILILWRKKKLRGDTIPFGPFLALGTILAFFCSDFFLKLLMLKLY